MPPVLYNYYHRNSHRASITFYPPPSLSPPLPIVPPLSLCFCRQGCRLFHTVFEQPIKSRLVGEINADSVADSLSPLALSFLSYRGAFHFSPDCPWSFVLRFLCSEGSSRCATMRLAKRRIVGASEGHFVRGDCLSTRVVVDGLDWCGDFAG